MLSCYTDKSQNWKLEWYKGVAFQTATFMASFAQYHELGQQQRVQLSRQSGSGFIPAMEFESGRFKLIP